MYARTDLELIARHHQTERRNEATATRRSRKLQDFIATPRRQ
ncbi:MAG: hypothetical protein ABIR39_05140 [Nocardioides sp.]